MQIIRDNSTFRIGWDFFLLLLILISCVIIPYQIVFQHEVLPSSTIIIHLIDIIFILDIYFNFHTSFRHKGGEVIDKKKIFQHYSKTLLPIDLIANIPFDVLLLLLAPKMTFYNVSLVLIFRLLRLLRVPRLFVILKRWEFHTWSNSGYLRKVRFIVTIVLLIHWIACACFMSTFVSNFPDDSWVVSAQITEVEPYHQYIGSLYWTIATMTTAGYGDITPQRPEEYLIAMVVMLLGASLYAFIIGNIASLFSNLDAAKVQYCNRMEAITQYRKVPEDLNIKVRNYYEYKWTHRRGIQDEKILFDLPGPLRLEILLQFAKELLENVPLFKHCSASLKNTLLDALVPHIYPPDGFIAQEEALGKEIFFISKGKLEVSSKNEEKNTCHFGRRRIFWRSFLIDEGNPDCLGKNAFL